MIDIHSHIIFNVDDGSKSLKESIKYLDEIKKVGIEKVVCTPHIKNKSDKLDKIKNNYSILLEEATKRNIKLYLGNEIMYSSKIIELLNNKDILSLNNTKYVLVEFKRNEDMDEDTIVNNFNLIIEAGYKPILAHPELYKNYRNIDFVKKLREIGVMMQLDATSILPNAPIDVYFYSKKLIGNYLIDIVASDSHCTKKRNFKNLSKAYKKLIKINKEYTNIIFYENPNEIIK